MDDPADSQTLGQDCRWSKYPRQASDDQRPSNLTGITVSFQPSEWTSPIVKRQSTEMTLRRDLTMQTSNSLKTLCAKVLSLRSRPPCYSRGQTCARTRRWPQTRACQWCHSELWQRGKSHDARLLLGGAESEGRQDRNQSDSLADSRKNNYGPEKRRDKWATKHNLHVLLSIVDCSFCVYLSLYTHTNPCRHVPSRDAPTDNDDETVGIHIL